MGGDPELLTCSSSPRVSVSVCGHVKATRKPRHCLGPEGPWGGRLCCSAWTRGAQETVSHRHCDNSERRPNAHGRPGVAVASLHNFRTHLEKTELGVFHSHFVESTSGPEFFQDVNYYCYRDFSKKVITSS